MNENKAKETYVKPECEVVDLKNELPILCGSGNGGEDFGNGGFFG